MRYRAVILDVDGTLLDSNHAHAQAFVEAMRENGYSVEFATVRRLIGKGSDKLLPEAIGVSAESKAGQQIGDRKGELFKQLLPQLKPTPGAQQLVEKLREAGLKRVVASSAGADEIHLLLQQAGVARLIEDETTADDAEDSKPDPDIVLAAWRKTGARRGEAIMIGDTPYDVEAARRAGIEIIALRCGGWGDQDLAGAVEIYDNPADLLRSWDASILATSA